MRITHIIIIGIASLSVPVQQVIVLSQANPDHTFNVIFEDGISTAVNTGGPKYDSPIFTFREILRIEPDPDHEESYLYIPSAITLGDDGYYYIVDNGNYRIVVVDSEGKYVRSLGRQGSGPGEFLNPRMVYQVNGVLQVFDQALRRFTRYQTDGRLLDVTTIRDGGETLVEAFVSPDGRRLIVHKRERKRRRRFEDQHAVISFRNLNQHEMKAVESSPARKVAIQRKYPQRANMYFAPRPQVAYSPESGIIVSTGADPEIKCYNWYGNLTRTIHLDLPPRPVTGRDERLAWELFNKGMASANAYWRQKMQNADLIFPEYKAHWHDSRIDDAGYIWLIEYWNLQARDQGLGTTCKVISPEGEHLGTCYLPRVYGTFSDGHFLCIQTDESTGAEYPTIYKIESNVDGLIYPREGG